MKNAKALVKVMKPQRKEGVIAASMEEILRQVGEDRRAKDCSPRRCARESSQVSHFRL